MSHEENSANQMDFSPAFSVLPDPYWEQGAGTDAGLLHPPAFHGSIDAGPSSNAVASTDWLGSSSSHFYNIDNHSTLSHSPVTGNWQDGCSVQAAGLKNGWNASLIAPHPFNGMNGMSIDQSLYTNVAGYGSGPFHPVPHFSSNLPGWTPNSSSPLHGGSTGTDLSNFIPLGQGTHSIFNGVDLQNHAFASGIFNQALALQDVKSPPPALGLDTNFHGTSSIDPQADLGTIDFTRQIPGVQAFHSSPSAQGYVPQGRPAGLQDQQSLLIQCAPPPAATPCQPQFLCTQPDCHTVFKRDSDRIRHEASVHGINRPVYLCHVPGCNKSQGTGYKRKDKLTEHLWRKHADLGFMKKT